MKSSTFQYILLIFFGAIGVFGILIFAGIIPIGGSEATYEGEALVWGFVPAPDMLNIVSSINNENKSTFSIRYEYKDRKTFENDLVNALARGEGPDLVMFPHDLIIKQGDKLLPLPYENYSERDFRNNFAEAGEIFLSKTGAIAFPLYVDPLVMYWNRDIFTNAGLATYPKTWVDFLKIPDTLTQKDTKGNVFQSAVAMGTYRNISNAKDIISTLLLQVGDKIVTRNLDSNGLRIDSFDTVLGQNGTAAQSAIDFYTEFANQSKNAYSWNSSLPQSNRVFESGKLALYFGRASEYERIKINNPHLNFDIALVPQRSDSNLRITYGDLVGLSIVKTSKRQNVAARALYALSSSRYSEIISNAMGLPSLRRDILAKKVTDPVKSIFNDSAIISRAWNDPNKEESDLIFRDIIEDVSSGRKISSSAISDARIRLSNYVK